VGEHAFVYPRFHSPTRLLRKIGSAYGSRGRMELWLRHSDSNGRTIWIVDAHRDVGKRFVVRADEILTAFLELESAVRGCGKLL
jgi:hypothetical protein